MPDQPIGPSLPNWNGAERPGPHALVGRSVALRPIDFDRDLEPLFAALTDPREDATWTYMSYGPFRDVAAFERWARTFMASPEFFFYAWLVDEHPVGFACFMRIVPEHGATEIGHVVLAPCLRRTRAATEGFSLMMAEAFRLGNRRLEWKCDALNAPSRAAAARLGFRYEGTFEQHLIYKGRNRDTAWFAITDARWPAIAESHARWLDDANFDAQGRQRQPLARQNG